MAKKQKIINLGKISKKQLQKADRKGSRDAELENSTGWKSSHKIYKDKAKTLHRKRKHKGSGHGGEH